MPATQNKNHQKAKLQFIVQHSLTDVVGELSGQFEEDNQVEVKLNLASSGTLARQIEQGAPADIYLSANKSWMDYLYTIDLIEENSIKQCAGNSLVVITPLGSPIDTLSGIELKALPEVFNGRLSMGDPEYVPAGAYAREALQNLGCFGQLENRLLPAKDVRSALMVVELGEAEAGIVYKTDALNSKKVKIVGLIPDSLYQPVNYYIAMVKGRESQLTTNFYTFILSKEAFPTWEKYGFKP